MQQSGILTKYYVQVHFGNTANTLHRISTKNPDHISEIYAMHYSHFMREKVNRN